jgi:hypothetical protein
MFALVGRLSSIRTLFTIAASRKRKLNQMDVMNAFLSGNLEEVVYMLSLPRYQCPQNKVYHLHKALYGLKQAPRARFSKSSSTIKQLGFSSSPYDSALFIYQTSNCIVLLLLYVDGKIITGDDASGI